MPARAEGWRGRLPTPGISRRVYTLGPGWLVRRAVDGARSQIIDSPCP